MIKATYIFFFTLYSISLYAQKKTASINYMVTGKLVYQQHCMTCHQIDGTGAQNMIPPLAKTSYVIASKAALIKILLNGMSKEIKVNGDTYAGEMPAQAHLTDQEIAAVLSYVRNSFGNKASIVTAMEVKKVRTDQKTASKGKH